MSTRQSIPIYLTPTFHHDIAYLKPERVYTPACFEIIDEALHILETHEDYCFTIEQAWLLEQYWREKPERRKEMRKYAAQGRLSMAPGLYAVPDMNMLDGESLFMQASIGKEIVRRTLGLDPRACLIADSWGHHAQLPQILSQCGYAYYGYSRCMRRDVNVENYRWVSPDGTEINVHWYAMGYAGAFFPNGRRQVNAEELEWVGLCKEQIEDLNNNLAKYCGDDPRILPNGGDMMFPSRVAPSLVHDLVAEPGMPPIHFATLEHALDQIDWPAKDRFGGEFEASQKGTWSTNIVIKQNNQRYSRMVESLETLAAVLNRPHDFTLPWKLVLKQQFHDTICGTLCDEALLECERDYEATRIMLTETLDRFTNDNNAPAFFNALPFARTVDTLVDGKKHRIAVPALGFAPLAHAKKATEPESVALPLAFENEWYAASVDGKGFITSLVEKKSGHDVVGQQKTSQGVAIPFGGLMMQVDNGDNWEMFESPVSFMREHGGYNYNVPDPYDRDALDVGRKAGPHMPTIKSASAVSDGLSTIVTQEGSMQFWITQVHFVTTITFRNDSPRIEYHTEFPVQSKHMRVMAAYPANLAGGTVRHQIPYALIDRGEGLQAAQHFIDYQAAAGLAMINRGLPANNVEDGIMMLTLFRATAMEYKTQSELSYNLGKHMALDYAILPHAPQMDDMLWKEAADFNTPLLLTTMPDAARSFGLEGGFLSCLRADGDAIFMRVHDHLGEGSDAVITVPEGFTSYALTDGLQNPVTDSMPIVNGKVSVHLDPWRIQGILFSR